MLDDVKAGREACPARSPTIAAPLFSDRHRPRHGPPRPATPALSTFINNPTLSTKDRSAGLPAIYAAAGKEVSDITKNLFVVLSENGRLVETEGVIEGFNELVANYKGELNVTITSAAPLPKDIQTRL